ncbi:MAG: hypothetical protein H7328_04990 [Bdellovibrio sp.]|nr:hypothetical protein [Bdellovibrio sp.]
MGHYVLNHIYKMLAFFVIIIFNDHSSAKTRILMAMKWKEENINHEKNKEK